MEEVEASQRTFGVYWVQAQLSVALRLCLAHLFLRRTDVASDALAENLVLYCIYVGLAPHPGTLRRLNFWESVPSVRVVLAHFFEHVGVQRGGELRALPEPENVQSRFFLETVFYELALLVQPSGEISVTDLVELLL